MSGQSFNPGLSEKAWKEFHVLMARLNLKYASKMTKNGSKDATSVFRKAV
jgi:hypothetical protein